MRKFTQTRCSIAMIGVLLAFISLSSLRFNLINAVRVNWSSQLIKLENGEAEIRFTAQIPPGWHMFSQNIPDVNGPMPVNIDFDDANGLEVIGSPVEVGQAKPIYEPNIDMEVNSLEGQVTYSQRVKIASGKIMEVKGVINYMLSNGKEMLPPDEYEVIVSVE